MIILKIIFSLVLLLLFISVWIAWGLLIVYFMENMIYGFRGYTEQFCIIRFLKRAFGAVFWPLWIFIGWFFYD